jgi:thiol:disulfide interchange protein
MLWTIVIACIALWLFGMATSRKFGGFLHLLLVIAALLASIGPIEMARDAMRSSAEQTGETSTRVVEPSDAPAGVTRPSAGPATDPHLGVNAQLQ